MRNPYITLLLSSAIFVVTACSNGNSADPGARSGDRKMAADTTARGPVFTVAMVDNKKDPSCGMPVTAGIGDTVHYAGKVIGFCSKECKDDFMKDPVAGLKKTDFKK